MWLGFIALLAYLLVTIAGVTHKDLLLNSPVQLPVLNIKIPLFRFFIFAPVLLLILHLGLLIQHMLLAGKLRVFAASLQDNARDGPGPHPQRHRLHSYVLSQVIAGPKRHWLPGLFMRLMVWISLIVLPVATMIYFQVAFLPYHADGVTQWHRLAVVMEIALIVGLWPFIRLPPILPGLLEMLLGHKHHDLASALALPIKGLAFASIILSLLFFCVCVATVPEETMDRLSASWSTLTLVGEKSKRKIHPWTWTLFEKRGAWFSRNLVVADTDLVPDKEFRPDERTHSLRKRDLRFARLDRSDLKGIDFTDVDLRDASLTEAKLKKALAVRARLQRANLSGAALQGANLARAALQGANLSGVELQGANLSGVELQGADLRRAALQGADLSGAGLQGANLSGAALQGAILALAALQGANLRGVELQGANLSGVELQGADLRTAVLQGVDLSRLGLQGADLRYSAFWQSLPPVPKALENAELHNLNWRHADTKSLQSMLDGLKDDRVRTRVEKRVAALLDPSKAEEWQESSAYQAWTSLLGQSRTDAEERAGFLANLACGDETGGHIAKALSRRALDRFECEEPYVPHFVSRLNSVACKGVQYLSEETRAALRERAGKLGAQLRCGHMAR